MRLERLSGYTSRLEAFHSRYPDNGCCLPLELNKGSAQYPFGTGPVITTHARQLPASAFLVPSVLEFLESSEAYKQLTEVVPAEADAYCASYAHVHGGLILTGDSDLLVYDLGPNGYVCLFTDLSLDSPKTLSGSVFSPTAISLRLGLPLPHGIQSLAFELKADSHLSLRKALKKAAGSREIQLHAERYYQFSKDYALIDSEALAPLISFGSKSSKRLRAVLTTLDPRISEYVLQFPLLASATGKSRDESNAGENGHVFLPFLIDCPSRTNAWEMSTSVRQLAYGLMNLVVPANQQRSTIFEHRRRHKQSAGREWQLPETSQIPEACTEIINMLDTIEHSGSQGSCRGDALWTAVAVFQDIQWSSFLDKSPLCQIVCDATTLLEDKNSMTITWDTIHFSSQIQGSYYSFRMLKQILKVVTLVSPTERLPEQIFELSKRLESLPTIAALPSYRQTSKMIKEIGMKGILKAMTELCRDNDEDLEAKQPKDEKKRKRKKVEKRQKASARRGLANPFELLDMQ